MGFQVICLILDSLMLQLHHWPSFMNLVNITGHSHSKSWEPAEPPGSKWGTGPATTALSIASGRARYRGHRKLAFLYLIRFRFMLIHQTGLTSLRLWVVTHQVSFTLFVCCIHCTYLWPAGTKVMIKWVSLEEFQLCTRWTCILHATTLFMFTAQIKISLWLKHNK